MATTRDCDSQDLIRVFGSADDGGRVLIEITASDLVQALRQIPVQKTVSTGRDVYITVVGEGEFPYDMLRYDGCHPATEPSSNKLPREGYREIILVSPNRTQGWRPSDRWQRKFGWSVKLVTYDRPNEIDELNTNHEVIP